MDHGRVALSHAIYCQGSGHCIHGDHLTPRYTYNKNKKNLQHLVFCDCPFLSALFGSHLYSYSKVVFPHLRANRWPQKHWIAGLRVWCGRLSTDPNISPKNGKWGFKGWKILCHNFYPDIPGIIKDLRPSLYTVSRVAGVVKTVTDGVQGLMALASLAPFLMSWLFSRASPQCLTEAIRGKRSVQA